MGRRQKRNLSLAVSILSSCFLLTQVQGKTEIHITVDPDDLREGQSVTLTPGGVDPKQFQGCTWFRGTLENKNRIFTYASTPFEEWLNGPAFTGRETVDPFCSLRIKPLSLNDSGVYTLTMGLPVIFVTGNASITVSEILSNPVLQPTESLVAENTAVTLHCNTSDRLDVNIGWFKDSNPVLSKTGLSDLNRTLMLTGLTKEDEGIYTCQAANPVSKAISNPSKITVASSPSFASSGAVAGIVIGSLAAILVLIGTLTYIFHRVHHRKDKTSATTSAATPTPQIYENILPLGQKKPEVEPRSSSEATNIYAALQPTTQSVYEEIKR